MANFPGWFVSLDLSDTVAPGGGSGSDLDVSNLNFALVLHEAVTPPVERYTTWALQADSALVYQTLGNKNKLIIADAGNLYLLDDAVHTDDGVRITCTLVSIPYPIPTAEEPVTVAKRLHEVTWQVRTVLPVSGVLVTFTVQDVDDTANSVTKVLVQTTQKVNLQITTPSPARQFRFRWSFSTSEDYDIGSIGYRYQVLSRPYAAKT